MFFASTDFKPYSVNVHIDNGGIDVVGRDYNDYFDGRAFFYPEELLIDNFQEKLKEAEHKKLRDLEVKLKAVKKVFEEK